MFSELKSLKRKRQASQNDVNFGNDAKIENDTNFMYPCTTYNKKEKEKLPTTAI